MTKVYLFFEGLFQALALCFTAEPMIYLLGILVLAFIIFAFKMILRH